MSMVWICLILFLVLINGYAVWEIRKAPTDVELWGEEQE